MDLTEHVRTGADPTRLWELVSDLTGYPDWLGLVVSADPEPAPADAWIVELRGRIGPFARSKRLRMVRTLADAPHRVRFERAETDGRRHSAWRLEATITPITGGSELTMDLHYGGNRFAPVLAPLLREEIRRGRRNLQQRYPLSGSGA